MNQKPLDPYILNLTPSAQSVRLGFKVQGLGIRLKSLRCSAPSPTQEVRMFNLELLCYILGISDLQGVCFPPSPTL